MKTITIELSKDSCQKALKEIQKYQREVKPKMMEVCKRLAEIGAAEAQAHLTLARGNTDAMIEPPVQMDNGYKIVMSGSDVYFVEFGTGSDVEPHFDNVSVPVFAGSWSMEHKQMYTTHGWWWYGGEVMAGTPAYMPMYYAGRKIREEIPRVVKEVFG